MIDPELARILRCPADLDVLEEVDEGLRCKQCGRIYPVREGIPVLLIEEATEGSDG